MTHKIKYLIIVAIFAVIIPASASAATVYVESSRSTVSVGDTAIVTVKINADGAVLNTIDGDISLKSTNGGNLAVQEFSLANSSFGLWPRTPSLSKDGKTISFVGGVPGGFSIEGATLFKIVVEATREGTITVSPQNISAFLNDGNGTKVPAQLKDVTINVVAKKSGVAAQNDWSNVVSKDTTPPEDFIIVFGQDKNLFSGKKFAFFSAVDNQSGIDHYDVSENGAPAVRSGSTYVMQDQSDSVKLSVIAYDKAGNKKSASSVAVSASGFISWQAILIIAILAVVAWFIIKKIKKSKNKTNTNAPSNA